MPADGVPGFLNYRVVNRLTGAVVVANLPHLHQSYWRVNAMQQGAPGSAAVGTFRIPLYPPQTDDFRAAKAFYDQLDYGLRVEGYTGPVAAGSPRYAGIITGIRKSFNTYELTGFTDLWAAQVTRMFPSEGISSAQAGASIPGFFGRYPSAEIMKLGEDFSAYNAANYTAVGTWTTTTDQGLNAITCSAGVDSTLTHKTATASLGLAIVEVSGRISTSSTDVTNAGMVGVGDNGLYARLVLRFVATGNYTVDVQLYNGAVQATAASVFTGVPASWNFTMQMVTQKQPSAAGGATWRAILNGKDTGILFASTSGASPALYYNAPATGAAQVWLAQFYFADRSTPFLSAGTLGSPSVPTTLTSLSNMAIIDLWTMVATYDGGYWRWTPGYQTSAVMGTLDYGAAPGVDRSASVRFVENDNLIDASIEPNAEFFATTVRVPSAQLNDAGSATWRNLAATTTYGAIQDVVPILGATDYYTARKHASAIVANKTNLNNAKVITVLRDPATTDVWRELDYVTVHSPTLGLNNVKALVLAYDFTEGAGTQNLWLDQYAVGSFELAAARMRSAHLAVSGGFASR